MNIPSLSSTRKDESIHKIHSSERVNISVLGLLERPAIQWLVVRIPASVKPDHLTALGLLGSITVGAGYVLSNLSPGYLWLASLGYIIHWFGDALDGALARFRLMEKPAYGLFIDHSADALSATFTFLGLGLSPYVRFDIGCLVLVTFLLMEFMIILQYSVNGIFRLSYGPIGPTEIRVIAIAVNTLAYFWGANHFHWFGISLTIFDLFCLALTGIGYAVFMVVVFMQARQLLIKEQN
jgi:phosphatidylglycerophosphate synthase